MLNTTENRTENTNENTREVELKIIDAALNGLYDCGYRVVIGYGREAKLFPDKIEACAFMRGFTSERINIKLLCYKWDTAGVVRLELGAGFDVIADYSDELEIALESAFELMAEGPLVVSEELAGKIQGVICDTLTKAVEDVFDRIDEKVNASVGAGLTATQVYLNALQDAAAQRRPGIMLFRLLGELRVFLTELRTSGALAGGRTVDVDLRHRTYGLEQDVIDEMGKIKRGIFEQSGHELMHEPEMAVKRYLVFAGGFDYAQGGWQDSQGSFATIKEAQACCNRHRAPQGFSGIDDDWLWYQIADSQTGCLVKESGLPHGVIRNVYPE